jgi:hypothetical protein
MADMIAIVVEEYGDVKKLVAKKVPKPGKPHGHDGVRGGDSQSENTLAPFLQTRESRVHSNQ